MKQVMITALLLLQSLSVTNASEAFTKVTYLGTNQKTIINPNTALEMNFDLEVYNLDELDNIEAEVTKNLPENPVEAERLANERMGNLDQAKAIRMFKSVALLIEWDIKKLPAFVFGEGEYVIYGVNETAIAIKRYMNSRKR